LIRAPLSVTSVLDETTDVVAAAAPWASIVILTSLPFSFLAVVFVERLIELGEQAKHYGHALTMLATLTIVAFVVSLWGRAVWARACSLTRSRHMMKPGIDALRVPPVALASYLYTAAFGALLALVSDLTIIAIPATIAFSGLAIGTMELNERPSIVEPLKLIARHSKNTKTILSLLFVFTIGLVIAAVNLYATFAAALWLAHAFSGVDLSRWDVLLGFRNPHFRWLLLAGALVAVEPFWIAANVILVGRVDALESGEDLLRWLEEAR
jgi:hypothetical protein